MYSDAIFCIKEIPHFVVAGICSGCLSSVRVEP